MGRHVGTDDPPIRFTANLSCREKVNCSPFPVSSSSLSQGVTPIAISRDIALRVLFSLSLLHHIRRSRGRRSVCKGWEPLLIVRVRWPPEETLVVCSQANLRFVPCSRSPTNPSEETSWTCYSTSGELSITAVSRMRRTWWWQNEVFEYV